MITTQLASLLIAASVLTAAPVVQARDSIDVRIGEASDATLSASAAALHPHERERVVQFVVGNTLFALGHELGHALVSDLRLPVLGREEDAVDIFATLALLHVGRDFHVGSDFAHGVLVDAAKGLMLAAERDARMGIAPAFYGEHGLDQQRAYEVLCLMVGSDPEAFRGLAQDAMLPKERQETCQADFELAKTSWLSLLAPYLRQDSRRQMSLWERFARRLSPGSPHSEVRIEVRYSEAVGELGLSQMVLRTVGVIEIVREFVIQNLVGLQGGSRSRQKLAIRRMLFGIRSSAASPSATSWSITTPTSPVLLFPSDSLVSTMHARKGRTLFRQRLPSAEGEAG